MSQSWLYEGRSKLSRCVFGIRRTGNHRCANELQVWRCVACTVQGVGVMMHRKISSVKVIGILEKQVSVRTHRIGLYYRSLTRLCVGGGGGGGGWF